MSRSAAASSSASIIALISPIDSALRAAGRFIVSRNTLPSRSFNRSGSASSRAAATAMMTSIPVPSGFYHEDAKGTKGALHKGAKPRISAETMRQ